MTNFFLGNQTLSLYLNHDDFYHWDGNGIYPTQDRKENSREQKKYGEETRTHQKSELVPLPSKDNVQIVIMNDYERINFAYSIKQ